MKLRYKLAPCRNRTLKIRRKRTMLKLKLIYGATNAKFKRQFLPTARRLSFSLITKETRKCTT